MDPETTLQPDPAQAAQPPVTLPDQPPDWGPPSDETLGEWRWIYKAGAEGSLAQYSGKHIAVFQQKVWDSGRDPELLLKYVALKFGLDPERVVVAYID
jgi:hypothetical protein